MMNSEAFGRIFEKWFFISVKKRNIFFSPASYQGNRNLKQFFPHTKHFPLGPESSDRPPPAPHHRHTHQLMLTWNPRRAGTQRYGCLGSLTSGSARLLGLSEWWWQPTQVSSPRPQGNSRVVGRGHREGTTFRPVPLYAGTTPSCLFYLYSSSWNLII